ncbi:hypothetical protein [Clostridium sp.]|uniref:hypothetical protein n=1 Tax=Clostridium sp. TaxID=1506 RepID=UPI0028FDD587|nr:hypothetical protein [Clostridium sp.]MDU2284137.1 hypothetical protein [Clostridium sp.]
MKDLTGEVFDMLTVIKYSHREPAKRGYRHYWECKCECGKVVIRRSDGLKDKGVKSCGCYREKILKEHNFKVNNPRKTHGMTNTRLYKIYSKIKERCYYEKYPEYNLYGGRGIKMCDEWERDFMNFYNWSLNNGYNENLSIDRIDFNGNYEPCNCRWADDTLQANNKRNNIVLEYNGEKYTLPEWARKLKLPYTTLANRYRRGKSIEEILNPNKLR